MKHKQLMIAIIKIFLTVIIMFVFLLPLFWLITSSFKTPRDIFSLKFRILFEPTFNNYYIVIKSAFLYKLFNSAFIGLATVIIVLPFGLFAAYAFSRFRFAAQHTLFFILLTTTIAPPVAFAVPIFMLFRRLGLLDAHLSLILCYVLFNIGFTTWVLRGFIEDVPREIEEAALVDGCSPWGVLFKITLPLISNGIVTTGILVFIFSWNEFLFASLLTRTKAATFTTHLVTYFGSRRVLWGELCAAATIGALVPIALALLTRKYIIRGMTFGAIKG
ncbi:MAG: carbohydrate ABC transporter permease [Methanomassiliicoccales archaeon]|nr:carbohydrate ABC transporter permease [Methanomassiliicoccales archaeon]